MLTPAFARLYQVSVGGLSEEQQYKALELRRMNQAPRIRWSTEPVVRWARKSGTVNLAAQRHHLRLMTFSNHDDLLSLLKATSDSEVRFERDEMMFVNMILKSTGGIVIYGKGDEVYGDDCYDMLMSIMIHMVMKGDESNDLSSRHATK